MPGLLVEKEFRYPADLCPDSSLVLPYTGKRATSPDAAVDEVIERAMDTGGDVFFYGPQDLGVYQRIAAALRR